MFLYLLLMDLLETVFDMGRLRSGRDMLVDEYMIYYPEQSPGSLRSRVALRGTKERCEEYMAKYPGRGRARKAIRPTGRRIQVVNPGYARS